jgi:hypothetical protein
MSLRSRVLLGFLIFLFCAFGVGKTVYEIKRRPLDAWGKELREELLTSEARDNPGHRILNPAELERGNRVYLPTPPAIGNSDLTAQWRSEPADMTWTTTNGPTEDGEQFAERAGRDFTAMLRVFPRR